MLRSQLFNFLPIIFVLALFSCKTEEVIEVDNSYQTVFRLYPEGELPQKLPFKYKDERGEEGIYFFGYLGKQESGKHYYKADLGNRITSGLFVEYIGKKIRVSPEEDAPIQFMVFELVPSPDHVPPFYRKIQVIETYTVKLSEEGETRGSESSVTGVEIVEGGFIFPEVKD